MRALEKAPLVVQAFGATTTLDAMQRLIAMVKALGTGDAALALRAAYGIGFNGPTLEARRLLRPGSPTALESSENRAIEELAARLRSQHRVEFDIVVAAIYDDWICESYTVAFIESSVDGTSGAVIDRYSRTFDEKLPSMQCLLYRLPFASHPRRLSLHVHFFGPYLPVYGRSSSASTLEDLTVSEHMRSELAWEIHDDESMTVNHSWDEPTPGDYFALYWFYGLSKEPQVPADDSL